MFQTREFLLLVVGSSIILELVVLELVAVLAAHDDTEVILELLLLEVLLGEVLDVTLAGVLVGKDNGKLGLLAGDGDGAGRGGARSIDLDFVVEELLETSNVDNLILDGDGAVDDNLLGSRLLRGHFYLFILRGERNEGRRLGTQDRGTEESGRIGRKRKGETQRQQPNQSPTIRRIFLRTQLFFRYATAHTLVYNRDREGEKGRWLAKGRELGLSKVLLSKKVGIFVD